MGSQAHVDSSGAYGQILPQIAELQSHFATTGTLIERKAESLADISRRYTTSSQKYKDDDVKDVFAEIRTQLAQLLQVVSDYKYDYPTNSNTNIDTNIQQKSISLKDFTELDNRRNRDVFRLQQNRSQDSLSSPNRQTDVLRNITDLAPSVQSCVDELLHSISTLSQIAPSNVTNTKNLGNLVLSVKAVVESFEFEPRIHQQYGSISETIQHPKQYPRIYTTRYYGNKIKRTRSYKPDRV